MKSMKIGMEDWKKIARIDKDTEVKRSGWISVKDWLPELTVRLNVPSEVNPAERHIYRSSSHVLMGIFNHDEDSVFVEMGYFCPETGGWNQSGPAVFHNGTPWNEVTHWQPLPAPPRAAHRRRDEPVGPKRGMASPTLSGEILADMEEL